MRNKVFIKIFAVLFLMSACGSSSLIGMQKSKESKIPNRIIWLQVPGLLEEHLAMLRFDYTDSRIKSAPEKAICFAKTWQYDLYRLRHSSDLGFLAQMNGTKNLKNTCEDFKEKPFWSYLQDLGPYKVAWLERGGDSGLEQSWKCEKSDESYRKNVMILKMDSAANDERDGVFHFQEKMSYESGKLLVDKSCGPKSCYASLEQNALAVNALLKKETKSSVFVIRDNRYENALRAKNISSAKEILAEIVKLYEYFQIETQALDDTLLLLTTSEGIGLEMPAQGVSWQQFQKKGANVYYRRSSLLGTVYADGVQAQNFCGQYEESEIFQRILWTPKGGLKNFGFL